MRAGSGNASMTPAHAVNDGVANVAVADAIYALLDKRALEAFVQESKRGRAGSRNYGNST